MIEPTAIAFRPLRQADFSLVLRWLNTPHVRDWWRDAPTTMDGMVEQYGPRVADSSATACYCIVCDSAPIGFIQVYRIADYEDYAAALQVGGDAAGVDLFIGEVAYAHRGLGALILRAFLRQVVFDLYGVASCVIGPSARNTIAIRAYEKAGFRYLKTVDAPGEDEPEYLMSIMRDESRE